MLSSCSLGCCRVVFRCGLFWSGRRDAWIVWYGDQTDGTDVWATPTAQSAVGEPVTNVATESGNAETAVSSSDGPTHQSWRCASGQDDVRCL